MPAPAAGTVAPPGLIVAAPASGSGKTVITLGLLRLLAQRGLRLSSFKVGPDYIDPAFHAAATGRACHNLDLWAMRPETAASLLARLAAGSDLVVGEGVMGLFDGAADGRGDGRGSTADVAAWSGLPVLLVVDVRGQGASAAAVLRGFMTHRPDVTIGGVIFNRTGGEAHADLLRRAVAPLGVAVLGCVPRHPALALPERHLGLVQAREHRAFAAFLDGAAACIGARVDLAAVLSLARPMRAGSGWTLPTNRPGIPPLGQRIAVARDDAFAFAYAALLEGWRQAGAEIDFFSPLADEAPPDDHAVYLPGGYPELHAARLAGNRRFLAGVRRAAARGAVLFGECGGYMVLGQGLVDADGARHAMAGLLPVETSFAARKLHLGYRRMQLAADGPLGRRGAAFRGHEFHYSSERSDRRGEPLFHNRDSAGRDLGPAGSRQGAVSGSFCHLIDAAPEDSPATAP